jgi:PAS domain S-box-containing protein
MESQLREHRHPTDEEASELGDSVHGAALGVLGGGGFRVLHIDDDPNDRQLVARELRAEIPAITIIEVGEPIALEEAMRDGNFDLVITDYQLRWTNGLEVLNTLKEAFPTIPLIMFTGTGNEEVAVEAMKAGVHDYILKAARHFPRLRSAVRQALQNVQQGNRLATAEARYKELFETVPVGLFRSTPKGEILDANQAFLAMAGVESIDALAHRNFSEIHPDPLDFAAWRDKLERDGAVTCVESRFRGSDGSPVWVEIHAKALRDPGTRQIYYEGSVENISERKGVELEREQLIEELRQALSRVRSLAGLLPICSSCKKIRDSGGQWNMLESYIENHSQAHFTHSFCPDCARRLYPEIFLETPKQ